jgi:hypothetical protein
MPYVRLGAVSKLHLGRFLALWYRVAHIGITWAAEAKYGRELPIKVRIAKFIPVGSWSGVNSKMYFIYSPFCTVSAVGRRVTPAIIRSCDIFDIS